MLIASPELDIEYTSRGQNYSFSHAQVFSAAGEKLVDKMYSNGINGVTIGKCVIVEETLRLEDEVCFICYYLNFQMILSRAVRGFVFSFYIMIRITCAIRCKICSVNSTKIPKL